MPADELPVKVLDPREPWAREGFVDELIHHDRRVDVRLTLDDGRAAEACLEPDDVVWMGLRPGDIVGVRELPVLPECNAQALLLSAV
jgi:hypothetical protein